METKPSSFWATVGDIAHAISIVNVLAFAYVVGWHGHIMDATWRKEGFCVMNRELPYWTSHDLCLYADVTLSAVLAVLLWLLHAEPGMHIASQMIKPNLLGIVAHGIGHGAIASIIRQQGATSTIINNQHLSAYETGDFGLNLACVPFLIFWTLLLRSAMPQRAWSTLAVLAVAVFLLQQLFPLNFGFTYTQSVLIIAFSWNEIAMKPIQDKGFEYAIYPCIVGVPLTMIAWMESTLCSELVIRLGGHLIYDAYIPLALMSFYMICWLKAALTAANTTTGVNGSSTAAATTSNNGVTKTKVA